ncbi:hypothetical protein [Vibrio alginolyticus]|uniref:hypothetical protein n=1 Tax=Vibrio alginolyticus TaxID=663 RepID=UPI0006CAA3DF|nr:hypothetical protein [Vibrio alginolyticus]KPM97452.1 hypothetical protein AOG25_13325 [Vibrio alginolyticus]CAH7184060.1 conserved hypothetical protein [Vibrio chagasii]CAH7353256.1 conserved hypothetical protein [Vibrio chagasii]
MNPEITINQLSVKLMGEDELHLAIVYGADHFEFSSFDLECDGELYFKRLSNVLSKLTPEGQLFNFDNERNILTFSNFDTKVCKEWILDELIDNKGSINRDTASTLLEGIYECFAQLKASSY